jgi:hypothetical protein
MRTRTHVGRLAGLRPASRLDALLDALDQATSPRPCRRDWRKYQQRPHWKSILRQIIKESIGQKYP